jgi:phospholipid/cholesterol/gamma-HCH transport system substrate-binding protein
MTPLPEEKTSRFRHFRAALSRQARGRGKDSIAIVLLTLLAVALTLWVFTQQKASLPSWAPFVGEDFAHLNADFTSAQAITPGQGQAVVIAGVTVGKISTVSLEDGHAVVGLDIEPKYLQLIHPDASLLLRPKTNLNDMAIEISPGKAPGHVESGFTFPLSQTEPNVNLDAFLATLDKDTQQYLQLLVAGGAEGIGGRAHQLSGAFRRLQPFAHYIAKLNTVLAERREALRGAIHHFSELTTELGHHDREVERFVSSSKVALGNFANQQQAIQQALVEFPQALTVLKSALASSNTLTAAARPALFGLIPQAQALGPAFAAGEKFFEQTKGPIQNQIRPFTREVRPVVVHAKQGAAPLAKTVKGFGNSLGGLNSFFNLLAFKPKGKESFLFYAPWGIHNLNVSYLQDANGPVQRALAMITCNGTNLAKGITANSPYLRTIIEAARVPRAKEIPPIPPDPASHTPYFCGPTAEPEVK